MLADHRHLPEPVLEILQDEILERAARPVPGNDVGRLPDAPAGAPEPQVEFVILVADEPLVEEADPQQRGFAPAAVGHRIDPALVAGVVELRAAASHGRMVRRGDRAPPVAVRTGSGGTTDVLSRGGVQRLDASPHVIRSVGSVGVHAKDDVAARGANRHIEARGHRLRRIVDDADSRLQVLIAFEDGTRAVVARAVGDDDFPFAAAEILRQDGVENRHDRAGFVPAGDDNADLIREHKRGGPRGRACRRRRGICRWALAGCVRPAPAPRGHRPCAGAPG